MRNFPRFVAHLRNAGALALAGRLNFIALYFQRLTMGIRVMLKPKQKFINFANALAKRRIAPEALDVASEPGRTVRIYRLCDQILRRTLKRRNAFLYKERPVLAEGGVRIRNFRRRPAFRALGPDDGAFPIKRRKGSRLYVELAPRDIFRRQLVYEETLS